MLILAIDPGPTESAWLLWHAEAERIEQMGIEPNLALRERIYDDSHAWDRLVIEQIASYGMAVGAEVFQTCVESGRFAEAWRRRESWKPSVTAEQVDHYRPVAWVPRLWVKQTLCRDSRAKDTNIRQALIDRYGPQGTKKAPGKLYGVRSHIWAALAVAVTFADLQRAKGVA